MPKRKRQTTSKTPSKKTNKKSKKDDIKESSSNDTKTTTTTNINDTQKKEFPVKEAEITLTQKDADVKYEFDGTDCKISVQWNKYKCFVKFNPVNVMRLMKFRNTYEYQLYMHDDKGEEPNTLYAIISLGGRVRIKKSYGSGESEIAEVFLPDECWDVMKSLTETKKSLPVAADAASTALAPLSDAAAVSN